jgi:hypothetical protein
VIFHGRVPAHHAGGAESSALVVLERRHQQSWHELDKSILTKHHKFSLCYSQSINHFEHCTTTRPCSTHRPRSRNGNLPAGFTCNSLILVRHLRISHETTLDAVLPKQSTSSFLFHIIVIVMSKDHDSRCRHVTRQKCLPKTGGFMSTTLNPGPRGSHNGRDMSVF